MTILIYKRKIRNQPDDGASVRYLVVGIFVGDAIVGFFVSIPVGIVTGLFVGDNIVGFLVGDIIGFLLGII